MNQHTVIKSSRAQHALQVALHFLRAFSHFLSCFFLVLPSQLQWPFLSFFRHLRALFLSEQVATVLATVLVLVAYVPLFSWYFDYPHIRKAVSRSAAAYQSCVGWVGR